MNSLSPPEFQGYFWLPDHENTKIPGRCYTANDGRIELELLGTLLGDGPLELGMSLNQPPEIKRILGLTQKGEYVTLEDCFYKNRNYSIGGYPLSTIHVSYFLIGCHFDKGEPIEFEEIRSYSDAVNDWLMFAPIKTSMSYSSPYSGEISFSVPETLEWIVSDELIMNMQASFCSSSTSPHRDAGITQKTKVGFKYPVKRTIKDLLNVMGQFNDFVAFVVDQIISPKEIEVYTEENFEELNGKKYPLPIKVFYSPNNHSSPQSSRNALLTPLFQFEDVREKFGETVSSWLGNYEKFKSSFNLYFATKSGRNLYLVNRFLMLTQAMEALHRSLSNETPFTQEDYLRLCSILNKEVPNEFKDWLKPRLQYGNEMSLRNRLKSLLADFESIYGGSKKIKGIVDKVVDTRNYLTHYDESLKEKEATGKELLKLCLVLETLFQLHMTKFCGFSIKEVIKLSEESERFKGKLKCV